MAQLQLRKKVVFWRRMAWVVGLLFALIFLALSPTLIAKEGVSDGASLVLIILGNFFFALFCFVFGMYLVVIFKGEPLNKLVREQWWTAVCNELTENISARDAMALLMRYKPLENDNANAGLILRWLVLTVDGSGIRDPALTSLLADGSSSHLVGGWEVVTLIKQGIIFYDRRTGLWEVSPGIKEFLRYGVFDNKWLPGDPLVLKSQQ
ncbi:MAG: hypothetical protein KBD16_00280 [Candidatus Pacebacteria bacterium]|nr:hypothetical protein [Candidatus Paceibacterota bacterium]